LNKETKTQGNLIPNRNNKVAVLWVVAPCGQVFADVSEVLVGLILRPTSMPHARNRFLTGNQQVLFYQTTGSTTQKTAIFMLAAVRTSVLT
jgi:hypothetical protein